MDYQTWQLNKKELEMKAVALKEIRKQRQQVFINQQIQLGNYNPDEIKKGLSYNQENFKPSSLPDYLLGKL